MEIFLCTYFARWMFALNLYDYARWLTVHIQDLLDLQSNCPTVYEQFAAGHFVTQKSHRKFSLLAHDQVHEQLNALVKGDGGAIGITENESSLRRWMVGGAEEARLLSEFKNNHNKKNSNHHVQRPGIQSSFLAQVSKAVEVIADHGNPYADKTKDLYTLDSKIIMPENVVETLKTIESTGIRLHEEFVEKRLKDDTSHFNDTIPRNAFSLFKSSSQKQNKPTKASALQTDV